MISTVPSSAWSSRGHTLNYIVLLLFSLTLSGTRGGGGGGRGRGGAKGRIFTVELPNLLTFPKIYWRTRFWRNIASRVLFFAMATHFSKFDFLVFFSSIS